MCIYFYLPFLLVGSYLERLFFWGGEVEGGLLLLRDHDVSLVVVESEVKGTGVVGWVFLIA